MPARPPGLSPTKSNARTKLGSKSFATAKSPADLGTEVGQQKLDQSADMASGNVSVNLESQSVKSPRENSPAKRGKTEEAVSEVVEERLESPSKVLGASAQAAEGNRDEVKVTEEAPIERAYDITREERAVVLAVPEQNSPKATKSNATSPVARAQGTQGGMVGSGLKPKLKNQNAMASHTRNKSKLTG